MGYQRRVHGGDWSLLPQSLRASQRPHESAQKLEREREEGEQIKRISSPESNLGEISESGINPENLPLNLISSFGSRSEQISASRKPLFLDTTLCLKEPSQETMIAQGQESCLHTPVWGVEGFNISTSKEVEGELTTGKQHTRVFNGLNNHNVEENSNDTAMINTINFDDLLLGETVAQSTSTATGRARLAGRRGRGSWPRRRRSWPPCSRRTSSCRPSSRIWRRRWPHTRKGSLSRSPE